MRARRPRDEDVGPLKATMTPPVVSDTQEIQVMRPASEIQWDHVWEMLERNFGFDPASKSTYDDISKEDQLKGYEMMQLCRAFENACNQAYMQGKIRGFMHLDNGQVGMVSRDEGVSEA